MPTSWFVVEDGTGKDDAVSYASIDSADDYHERRGNAAWDDLSDDQKRAALVLSTDFIEQEFGQRFKGMRVSSSQSLSWPRIGVIVNGFDVPDDELPKAIDHHLILEQGKIAQAIGK